MLKCLQVFIPIMSWKRCTGTRWCPWQSRRLECMIKTDKLRLTQGGRTCYWWCPYALCSLCPHNLNISLHWFRYITDSKDTATLCALLLSIKKLKKFCVHPLTSQRLLNTKFYSLYEDVRTYVKKSVSHTIKLPQEFV